MSRRMAAMVRMALLAAVAGVWLCLPSSAFAGLDTWTTSGPPGGYVYSLAFSPEYIGHYALFAGGTFFGAAGIFESTSTPPSWTAVNTGLPGTAYVYALAFSPDYASNHTDHTVFAGTDTGVYESTSADPSWTEVDEGLESEPGPPIIRSLVVSPDYVTDHALFAGGTWFGGAMIMKSTSLTPSWTVVDKGLPGTANVHSLALSPDYATDHTVFAGTDTGVYESTSGGASWKQADKGLESEPGPPVITSLAVSPAYHTDHTLFAGGTWLGAAMIMKSTSLKPSWTIVDTGLPGTAKVHSLAFSPAYHTDHTVFAGTDTGVYESTSLGASWSAFNSGLATLPVYSVAVSPHFPLPFGADHTIFAGGDAAYSYTFAVPTLTASGSGTITYGASETVTGTLVGEGSAPLSGRTLTLQSASSAMATAWAKVATATTGADGVHVFHVSPTRTTYYRVRFAGDTGYADASSSVISVAVQVYLSTPTCSSTVHVNQKTTFAGYLKPHQSAGLKSVQLQFYHRVSGNWVHVKTVAATNANYSTYTRYAASASLASKGSWRVRAYHLPYATYLATYSGWKTFTVN